MRVQLSLLWSSFVALSLTLHVCAQGALDRLQAEAGKMRWNNLERIYESLPGQDKANPKALYLAGYGLMRLHKPQSAKPLLQQAITSGFHGWPGWTTAEQFLKDADELQGLTPPPLVDIPAGPAAKLKVFGRPTQWANVVLQAMPNYVNRAAEAFGADLPTVNFYLFDDRPKYERFFKLMFGKAITRGWQDGTGDSNVVVFCELNSEGRPRTLQEAGGDVLHEYGHCLCNTIFGDNYLDRVPQWFDEGAADAIARPYYDRLFEFSVRRIKDEVANGRAAPTYPQMCSEVYKDPQLRYVYARLMMQELLMGRPLSTLQSILNKARETQNFDLAIKQITGTDPADLIALVRTRYGRR